MQAHEADDVRGIRMKGLTRGRLVDARLGIELVAAEVLDVPEHMPLGVLRQRDAEMRADAEIDDRRLLDGIALDRNSAQQDETAAAQHFVTDPVEDRGEPGQRERVAVDVQNAEAPGFHPLHGGLELGELFLAEGTNPLVLPRGHIGAIPDGRSGNLTGRHGVVDQFLGCRHARSLQGRLLSRKGSPVCIMPRRTLSNRQVHARSTRAAPSSIKASISSSA